jgi:hypothetical protein
MDFGVYWRELLFEVTPETWEDVSNEVISTVNFANAFESWRFARAIVNAIDFRPFVSSLLAPLVAVPLTYPHFRSSLFDLLRSKVTNQRIVFLHSAFTHGLISFDELPDIVYFRHPFALSLFEATTTPLNLDPLSHIIRSDDVRQLNSVSASIHPEFEPFDLLTTATAIEYAAFWDSINCFCFFADGVAALGRSAEFACAGGAFRVLIAGVSANRFSLSDIAAFSALYHRRALFEWVLAHDDLSPSPPILTSAVLSDNVSALSLLLQTGIGVNSGLPFVTAALADQFDSFSFLLTVPGLSFDARDANGKSAFFCAAENGNTEMMRRILDHGLVNLSVRDGSGVFLLFLMVWLWLRCVGCALARCGCCLSSTASIRMSGTRRATSRSLSLCGSAGRTRCSFCAATTRSTSIRRTPPEFVFRSPDCPFGCRNGARPPLRRSHLVIRKGRSQQARQGRRDTHFGSRVRGIVRNRSAAGRNAGNRCRRP